MLGVDLDRLSGDPNRALHFRHLHRTLWTTGSDSTIDGTQFTRRPGCSSSLYLRIRHKEIIKTRVLLQGILWVGNVAHDVTDGLLVEKFSKFGCVESVAGYSHRNYAFVNFENLNNARDAKNGLRGVVLGGLAMRIEFAKGEAGGQPSTATPHEEWGAANARDNRVHPDHFRSLPEPHRNLSDPRQSQRGSSCGSFRGHSDGYQAVSGPGSVAIASGKIRGEKEEPSDILWVGFPLLSKVDEDGLRRAFVPYGEVERVKTFPGRTYAFVQFKHIAEASRAKAALEGKLFNDPGVHIRFSNGEIEPVNSPRIDGNSFSPSQGKDALGFSQKQFGRVAKSDKFGSTVPLRSTGLRPEYLPGRLARGAALPRAVGAGGVISLGRGVGLGPSGERIPPDERDYQTGVSGFPGPGVSHPYFEQLNFRDEKIVSRESKRPRTVLGDGVNPLFHSIYKGGKRCSGSEVIGLDSSRQSYGLSVSRNIGTGDEYSQVSGLQRGRLRSLVFQRSRACRGVVGHVQSAASLRDPPTIGSPGAGKRESFGSDGAVPSAHEGWRWHGTIAEGGTPVCRARCLPVGKGIDLTIPDVVNCTARTDLDMLAKDVHQAGDFGVVFFVPEADPDVPPYHDFMHYLGEKHQAGVAKLVDGTTLFLVPPSELSERVLKVPGKNCLFGVVLKAQHPFPTDHTHLQQVQSYAPRPQQDHLPLQLLHLPLEHVVSQQQQASHSQGMVLFNGHSRLDYGALPAHPAQKVSSPAPTAATSTLTHSQSTSLARGLSTVLTPELIASLTALLPSQNPSAALRGPPRLSGSTTQPGSLRLGMGLGGVVGRMVPNSGSAIPTPAAVENWLLHRPAQCPQQSVLQSESWPSAQSDQQVGTGGHVSVSPQQGPGYAPPLPKRLQVSPNVAPMQLHSGPTPSLTQHAYLGAQGQGFQGPGYFGQQAGQHPRTPQHPMQLGGAPLLPSEQLAQLTALLTQTQQQPTQQQQAVELLQQHCQQQQALLTPLPQQHQPQVQSYAQQSQHQQELYALHPSTLQQLVQGVPLPQHLSQSLGQLHVVGSHWDGATGTDGHQQLQQLTPPPEISLPQQHVQQLLPIGGMIGEQGGGASQDDTERQKRFQATLQLAVALLQQMHRQKNPGQEYPEQR